MIDTYIDLAYGCFAEHVVLSERAVFRIPSPVPSTLPLLVSGLTASIALEEVGEIKAGQTVLVTGAVVCSAVSSVRVLRTVCRACV